MALYYNPIMNDIKVCEEFKPHLLMIINNALKYTSYVRMTVYKQAYDESSWCKEKTNRIDTNYRLVLNKFCDYCLVKGQLSVDEFKSDAEFISIMSGMHQAYDEMCYLVIDINHKNNTSIMDYNSFSTDSKRKEGLDTLLKEIK